VGGYSFFNEFLYTKNYIQTHTDWFTIDTELNKLYTIFTNKFPKNPDEIDDMYEIKIAYYLFINLYATIQKYPKSFSPFKVYRISSKQYLNNDPNQKFYTNCFMSTSYLKIQTSIYNYIFYVHPLCNYINLVNTSDHPYEKEILFSPYHIYRYVKEEKINNEMIYYYTLLPINIDIPNTVEDFIPFKDSHIIMTGGKNLISRTNTQLYKMSRPINKTFKLNRSPEKPANTTRTAKNENQNTFLKRMNLEIKSFSGGPFTEKEKKMSDDLVAYFEKI
jgi:hypothetical protein